MAIKKASEALVEALAAERVEYVFGLPGGHSVCVLYDALARQQQVKTVLARHESAGAFAALGYAQLTRGPGVCQGTAGPGFSQMLTGIHEAAAAKLPLIVIAPNAPISGFGKGELQEFAQTEAVLGCAKWSYRLDRPEKVPWVVQQAFKHAMAPPCGPVVIDIPLDIGDMEADIPDYVRAPRSTCVADDASVEAAARALLSADRPVMVCGRGVHRSGAYEQVERLAELLAMPVCHTNHGKTSIREDHPLAAGGVGCNRTVISDTLLAEADCCFWVGSQIEEFAAGKGWPTLPEGCTLINLNIDPTQFGRNWTPEICLLGDARLTLARLIEACLREGFCQQRNSRPCRRPAHAVARAGRQAGRTDEGTRPPGTVHHRPQPPHAARRGDSARGGRQSVPGNWVSASDFGCMGFAVGAAIGAAVARPDTTIICLTGDGSFQMQMQEIVVAAQYSLPITYVVLNNNALGWIKWGQKTQREGRFYCTDYSKNWDHVAAAEAAGLEGFRVDNPAQSGPAILGALRANKESRPALIEVAVPWDEQTPGFHAHHLGGDCRGAFSGMCEG